MITHNELDTLARATAYGPDGTKLGKVGEVYLDNRSGEPGWITVVTGLFGTRRHFVPVDEATLDRTGVHVPFDKDTVTGAPNVEENGELTPLEEDELYRYYSRSHGNDSTSADANRTNRSADAGRTGDTSRFGDTDRSGTLPPDAAREGIAGDYRPSHDTQRDDSLQHSVPGNTATTPSGTARGMSESGEHTAGAPSQGTSGIGSAGHSHNPAPGTLSTPTSGTHSAPDTHSTSGTHSTHGTHAAPDARTTPDVHAGHTSTDSRVTGTPDTPSTTDHGPGQESKSHGSGGEPRKPRLVKRVVTTEYYEETPDDSTQS
ncbi:PRC-barrel domain-containing protein [Rhodococcus coprophilus]|uniref:Uncharacterized protein conserved in bacteria n=1 Tax=Rhodococcus coprophilus TaxID=38310 RepID=A0A2X4TY77_9NOCA|nr:PRC-barrel domain-containing protein [Rhodococcus coprophilus]MBM7458354.1 hypothetical protein [Rhodococcus coprophilus]SQI32397.1 Uncharacterized protein conserved in bacteria [Rhodococcus coprophilus]